MRVFYLLLHAGIIFVYVGEDVKVLLILTFYLAIQNHQLQIEEHRNNTLNQVAVVRANLEHEINTTFNLILGMVAYVANNPEVSDKEFKKIANLLTEMGCEIGQGYYFNHPLTADDFSTHYG